MQRRERVIDLRALCRCILEKWRFLLIAALIAGVALGAKEGYAQYKQYQGSIAAQPEEESADKTKETGTSKSEELKVLSESIDWKNAYLVDSIMARIDPYNEGKATADLNVRVGRYESLTETPATAPAAETAAATAENAAAETQQPAAGQAEAAAGEQTEAANEAEETAETQAAEQTSDGIAKMTDADKQNRELSILSYYTSCVLYRTDYTDVAQQLGEDPENIRELVTVKDVLKTDSLVSLEVIYPTEEGAAAILNSILDQIRALEQDAQTAYGEHTLMIANETSAVVADANMFKWANTRAAEITALINTRKTLDKNLSSGTTAAAVEVISKKEAVTAAVKKGCVGLVGGFAAALILVVLYLVAAGKVLSGREFNRHFGLRKIACVPGRKYGSLKGLDKLAASIDSEYYNHPQRSTCLQVADANLRAMLRPDAQVALVGDLPQEYIEKLAAEMNKAGYAGAHGPRYFAIPCLAQTPESVESVQNCDAAVIVAKAEISTYKSAGDVLDTVSLLGRDVTGSIVLM